MCYSLDVRPRKQKKRATIVDVAVKAGVSLGTVSRVMNNRRDVNDELRRRVTDAARLLRYVRTERGRRASRATIPIITLSDTSRTPSTT